MTDGLQPPWPQLERHEVFEPTDGRHREGALRGVQVGLAPGNGGY